MLVVDLRGDAPNRLALFPSGEERDFGMFEKGILLRGKAVVDLHVERRHPGRVIAIHVEGHLNEILQVLSRLMLLDFHSHTLSGPTISSGCTASSNCSPVRRPSSMTASRRVVLLL